MLNPIVVMLETSNVKWAIERTNSFVEKAQTNVASVRLKSLNYRFLHFETFKKLPEESCMIS